MNPTVITFPSHKHGNGVLCVYQARQHVPFDIKRIFTVAAAAGDVRGAHAHKRCSQLLVCVSGRIRVACDDGSTESAYVLEDMSSGLLVPPGVWATEQYMTDGAVMMVLCDHEYEEEDYIRDYTEFRRYRGGAR